MIDFGVAGAGDPALDLINAVVGLVFGLLSLFAPAQLAAIYGSTVNDTALALYRINGASLIGFAAVAWFVRNAPASEARRSLLYGFVVGVRRLYARVPGCGATGHWYGGDLGERRALAGFCVGLRLLRLHGAERRACPEEARQP